MYYLADFSIPTPKVNLQNWKKGFSITQNGGSTVFKKNRPTIGTKMPSLPRFDIDGLKLNRNDLNKYLKYNKGWNHKDNASVFLRTYKQPKLNEITEKNNWFKKLKRYKTEANNSINRNKINRQTGMYEPAKPNDPPYKKF